MDTEEVTHVGAKTAVRILLIDKQLIFREGLKRLFEDEHGFTVVGAAADPDETVKAIGNLEPDILLVGLSGRLLACMLQALHVVAVAGHRARTILLTTTIEGTQIARAHQFGVSGILLKDASPQVLYESVRSVAAGHCWLGQDPVDDLLERRQRFSSIYKHPFGLTARELEIIDAVRRGATNRQIAQQLEITSDTVKHHLTNVFSKIGVFTRLQLALFALDHNLSHDEVAGMPVPAEKSVLVGTVAGAGDHGIRS